MKEQVRIVGAGPVGTLLALGLSDRGYQPELFEKRPDMRVRTVDRGKSINLALSVRGLTALDAVGLRETVLQHALPMRGRQIHKLDGSSSFQAYSLNPGDCIYSLSRGELNRILLDAASTRGIPIYFEVEFPNVPKNFLGWTIGADGAHSAVRAHMEQHGDVSCTESLLEHGYKELLMPAAPPGTHALEPHALHIWPRKSFMLIALPNLDGSFTCTLFLARQGPESFEGLADPESVERFFSTSFPDVLQLIPDLASQFLENPLGRMITVRTSPWSSSSRLTLIGDAAHAIVPFYGQGMNCGFEDCRILSERLASSALGAEFLEELFRARKPNSDSIADMALENFVEMRDLVADPFFLKKKQVEGFLQKHFPDHFVSQYSLVTFSNAPYAEAQARGLRNQHVLDEVLRILEDRPVESLTPSDVQEFLD